MVIIQIILVLFIIFVVLAIISKYKRKEITAKEFIFWLVFWALVLAAVVYPKNTDRIAQLVGVGRGADLLVYISILILFFIVFKIFVKLEKIDADITKIIRKIALDEGKRKEDGSNQQDKSKKN